MRLYNRLVNCYIVYYSFRNIMFLKSHLFVKRQKTDEKKKNNNGIQKKVSGLVMKIVANLLCASAFRQILGRSIVRHSGSVKVDFFY